MSWDEKISSLIKNSGEFYAKDVKEAVSKGFRRAFRYKGQPTSI